MGELTYITEYFLICSGSNQRQLQAIADEIENTMKRLGVPRFGKEGYDGAKWILLDYGDVVIHLFDKDMRSFYDLELLWGDAPKIPWESETPCEAGRNQ